VAIDTGASVTIARPDVIAEQCKRKPSSVYVLPRDSGEIVALLNEFVVVLTMGRRALRMWVFVADFTDISALV
jgi:hypothetical protein